MPRHVFQTNRPPAYSPPCNPPGGSRRMRNMNTTLKTELKIWAEVSAESCGEGIRRPYFECIFPNFMPLTLTSLFLPARCFLLCCQCFFLCSGLVGARFYARGLICYAEVLGVLVFHFSMCLVLCRQYFFLCGPPAPPQSISIVFMLTMHGERD